MTINLTKTASVIVAEYGNIAADEAHSLVSSWNIGREVRFAVDSGVKLADVAAAVVAADVDGYAVRRGVSAANLSKMGKLVSTWATFEGMVDELHAADGVTVSFRSAYDLAVKKGQKAAPKKAPTRTPKVVIEKGADVATVAATLKGNLSKAEIRQLLALLG